MVKEDKVLQPAYGSRVDGMRESSLGVREGDLYQRSLYRSTLLGTEPSIAIDYVMRS